MEKHGLPACLRSRKSIPFPRARASLTFLRSPPLLSARTTGPERTQTGMSTAGSLPRITAPTDVVAREGQPPSGGKYMLSAYYCSKRPVSKELFANWHCPSHIVAFGMEIMDFSTQLLTSIYINTVSQIVFHLHCKNHPNSWHLPRLLDYKHIYSVHMIHLP